MDAEPVADCDSSAEEPEDQEEDYTYASMEEGTTESECDDDAEELSTADIRWEKNKSYLNILNNWQKRHTVHFPQCITVNVTM